MRRRQFLAATAGLSLATLGAGCQSTSADGLKIALLEGSVPPQLIQAFKRQFEAETVSAAPAESLLKLYELLQTWHQQTPAEADVPRSLQPVANWVTLGDYWLASAIQQELIQPVDVAQLKHWSELPDLWPQLVQRNARGELSNAGSIWGVPYRWSSLSVLYDPKKLPADRLPLTQWQDLLHPALAQRIVLPDHPRLVIGLGLKAVGASANVEDPAQVAGLVEFLKALHQQVRFYSSDYFLETLIIGDASAVIGWTAEIQPVLKQYRQFSSDVPGPGTLLGADLWVQPREAQAVSFAAQWPDFCLSADFANQFASYSQGVSPRLWGIPPQQLPEALQQQPFLSPQPAILDESEFLLPLSTEGYARYLELWQTLRT